MELNNISALVIDDDNMHSKILERRLNDIGINQIKIINKFDLGHEQLKSNNHDIWFLDFYLDSEKTCLDFGVDLLKNSEIPIIYQSSFYDDSTFERIPKRQNISFLSKSASTFEIKKEIEILLSHNTKSTIESRQNDLIFIKKGNTIIKVSISEIIYIEVDGKYLNLIFENKKHLIRKTLTDFYEILPNSFVKIHQSIIVNLDFMDSINISESIIVLNGVSLPISRSHKRKLLSNKYFS